MISRFAGGAARAAIIVGLSVAVSSCSGGTPAASPSQIEADPRARQSVAGLFAGSATLNNAEDVLIQRCMTAQGFKWTLLQQVNDFRMPQPYGDDASQARVDGFGIQRAITERNPADLEADVLGLTPADQERFRIALDGPESAPRASVRTVDGFEVTEPTEGCRGEARQIVYGSIENHVLYQQLRDTTVPNVLAAAADDPKLRPSFTAWQECMASRGYPNLASREEPRSLAEGYYGESSQSDAFRQEVQLAVADAECDQSSQYTAQRLAAEDRALTRFLVDNEAVITSVLEQQDQALANARGALGVAQ